MSRINCLRKGCIDVFNAFLVSVAQYTGLFEFPCIRAISECPNKLISFSKAVSSKDYDQWIHFYEDDHLFERLWRNPKKYLELLKRFKGVILPDFSVYRDMPLAMQIWNIYRSRAIGHWLQVNGIKVIPNVRYGDKRTVKIACEGISRKSIIAIGSHGVMKNPVDRKFFLEGLETVVKILCPKEIVIYGTAPSAYFDKYREEGIKITCFESDYATFHKEVV